ncbi:MAG: LLM class flavin-dependent oxidoreductase [Euzebya tangerina]
MSALAAATNDIQLFASVALPTLPPAMVARMATTIDDVSDGRFGINIVTGWNQIEYSQQGLWPGDWYYEKRYDYGSEYVQVMQDLWSTGQSDFKGEYFEMDDCRMLPTPKEQRIPLVCAGQSDRGMEFCANYGDYQFVIGDDDMSGVREASANLQKHAEASGRKVGVYALYFVIGRDTDEEAEQTWQHYKDGADLDAIAFMTGQAGLDTSGATAETITNLKSAFNLNIGAITGSWQTCADKLDALGEIPGVDGVMCVFDDYPRATKEMGENIMPLMKSRPEK